MSREGLSRHQSDSCVELKKQRKVVYVCPECLEIFEANAKMNQDGRQKHNVDQREQVIAFATNVGLVGAGDIPKSASEMMG